MRRALTILICLLLVSFASACGGSDDDPDGQELLDATRSAIQALNSVSITEMYVSQQFASPVLTSPSPTPTPEPNVTVGFSEDPLGIFEKRTVVNGDTYIQKEFLWNVEEQCAILDETCLKTMATACLQLVAPCGVEPFEIVTVDGVRYVRPATESSWTESSWEDRLDDAADGCWTDSAGNDAIGEEFVMLSFITEVESAGERELGDRNVAVIEAQFEAPELVSTDECPLPSLAFTGLNLSGRITLWIDTETMLPLQVYRENEIYQDNTLLVREYRLAAYEDFNEAEFPGPLPD